MGNKRKEALIKFNRDNLIASARKLFEEKGIEATTVDDIAKEADCSKSTLYVYFKSKDEILYTILLEHMNMLKKLLEDCIRDFKDFRSCFFSVCRELVTYQQNYPFYYERMLDEIKISAEDIKEKNILHEIYEVGESINDIVKEMLQKGIGAGFIREDIELLPTVLFLWSGISESIRFANSKREYLKIRLNMEPMDYMEYGFEMLLKSISK